MATNTPGALHTRGFTLLELLVAMGVGALVMLTATGAVMQLYQRFERARVEEGFAAESLLMQQRLQAFTDGYTIDYDWYHDAYGSPGCRAFDPRQLPPETPTENTPEARAQVPYGRLFAWDTTGDGLSNVTLGGMTPEGMPDPCIRIGDGGEELAQLLLRSLSGTERKGWRVTAGVLEETHLTGEDTDGDGLSDTWTETEPWTPLPLPTVEVASLAIVLHPNADTTRAYSLPQTQPFITYRMGLQLPDTPEHRNLGLTGEARPTLQLRGMRTLRAW